MIWKDGARGGSVPSLARGRWKCLNVRTCTQGSLECKAVRRIRKVWAWEHSLEQTSSSEPFQLATYSRNVRRRKFSLREMSQAGSNKNGEAQLNGVKEGRSESPLVSDIVET